MAILQHSVQPGADYPGCSHLKMLSMKTDELIFVVLDGDDNSLVAVEGNIGMVVFGEDINEIREGVRLKVSEYFDDGFRGEVRIRRFQDIVLTI